MSAVPSSSAGAAAERVSLRQAVRNRILTEILGRVQSTANKTAGNDPQEGISRARFAVILDARSTRVLSSALLSHDLGERGVAIVENLQKSRQPFPQLQGIYIIEPTAENLSIIERDFHYWDTPLYEKAHVFLTRKPSTLQDKNAVENLYEYLRGKAVRRKNKAPAGRRPSRLATLIEANIDFLTSEDNVFHLDLPKALVQLFGPSDQHAVWCENRIVDGMASICATLNEYPFVRYAAGNELGESLARNVNERVEALLGEDKDFWFHGKDSGVRGTLLFLDRRQDLAAPLLHEFSYQALVYDLLETRDNLIRYQEPRRADETSEEYEKRKRKPKKALLNESDPLWVQFRHSHISTVIEQLNRITKELRQTTVGQYMELGGAEGVELSAMQEVVNELPAFREVMAKHMMHMAVCQACMDRVTERSLIDEARVEQTVVTGVDGEGERVSETKLLNEIAAMMRRRELLPQDKLRLACLHAVTLGQAQQETIQSFIREANLPVEAQNAILGLHALGVSLISGSNASGGGGVSSWLGRKKNKPLAGQELETPYRNAEAIQRAQAKAKTATIKTARYAPIVKTHLESICANRMTFEAFPFIKPPPFNSGLAGTPIENQDVGRAAHRVTTIDRSLSVRKHASTTASIEKKSATAELELAAQEKVVYQGGRIIVFIAGGATYSELRAVNEVMRLSKREIIIGSTHLLRPQDFMRDLNILGDDDAARRYLEEDVLSNNNNAEDFFLDDEERKMLDEVLIDGKLDPEEMARMQQEEIEQAEKQLQKTTADLGVIPWLMGFIPFCGSSLRAWFNGDDVRLDAEVEEEDDGIAGDCKKCFAIVCPCCASKEAIDATTDRLPLVGGEQPKGQVV